jgi:hypothetical protein
MNLKAAKAVSLTAETLEDNAISICMDVRNKESLVLFCGPAKDKSFIEFPLSTYQIL